MEFKKLDIKPQSSWLKRIFQSKHVQKTALYTLGGSLVGLLVYYLTDAKTIAGMELNEVINHVIVGGLFGLFITNSPCARNKC